MGSHRADRIADLLLGLLAQAVRDDLRDPRIGFVTLTAVEVSPDLKHARVFVSALAAHPERAEAVRALNHAAPFLRRRVAGSAGLRHMPDLAFVEDESLEHGARVESLLHDLHEGEEPDPEPERP